MVEALSLTGMIESPAVIILAQRPGPSTGLPTRTAQGEYNFIRHAGHGYFPRVLLAPKNIPECFELTARAFDLAEKYQVPVFIMTDQLLMDAQATVATFPVDKLPSSRHYLDPSELSAMKTYRRYEPAENGVSPMAAPGVSKHVVVVDSDEHSEEGHIVEAADAADLMASKRVRKGETVLAAAEPPVADGKVNRKPLVVSWGSSYGTIREAKSILNAGGKDFVHLHLRWLWPLQEKPFTNIISKASKVIAIENSVACDISSVIREVALRKPDAAITRRDGRPFDVETLVESLSREIK
jgi:2-oxoglutarate ferredoxin oxidoreductase subunit alpha